MTLRELMEKRAALVGRMRSINDAPEGESGDLSEAQQKEFSELRSSLKQTEDTIERRKLIDEADRRADGQPVTDRADADFDRECRSFSLVAAIAGAAGLDVDDGREREISAELSRRNDGRFKGRAVPMQVFEVERRAVTSTAPAGGPGGNLIGTDLRADLFIDILRAQMITQDMGATVISGLRGNVEIPKLTKSAASGWVAENSAITPDDHEFSSVSMDPKHVGAITEFSRNMLLQSSPDIEQLIRSDFAAVLARALDGVAIQGGGPNEPTGILATTSVDKTVSMATPSHSAVLDLINMVEENDAMVSGFVMRPIATKTLRNTPKVDSTDSVMVMEGPDSLAGYPVRRSTLVPNDLGAGNDETAIIAGQWSDLLIGYWSAFDLLVNPFESTAYSKGNVSVRGMLTADVALRHAESFAAAIDFPTS